MATCGAEQLQWPISNVLERFARPKVSIQLWRLPNPKIVVKINPSLEPMCADSGMLHRTV
jgi:hypothetical protein